jgi:hypothetical protein
MELTFDERRRREGNGEVVEPVGTSSYTDALCAHPKGKDLADDDPGDWTPGVSEVNGIEPYEDDGDPSGGTVVFPVTLVCTDNTRDNEMRDSHADTTHNQDDFASEAIDV